MAQLGLAMEFEFPVHPGRFRHDRFAQRVRFHPVDGGRSLAACAPSGELSHDRKGAVRKTAPTALWRGLPTPPLSLWRGLRPPPRSVTEGLLSLWRGLPTPPLSLWRGLRTPPRSVTEGLLSCTPRCGGVSRPLCDRRSPVLHRVGDLRSQPVARSGDRPTTRGPARSARAEVHLILLPPRRLPTRRRIYPRHPRTSRCLRWLKHHHVDPSRCRRCGRPGCSTEQGWSTSSEDSLRRKRRRSSTRGPRREQDCPRRACRILRSATRRLLAEAPEPSR